MSVAAWVSTGLLPWEGHWAGHEGHDITDVYVSSGTKVQCETCRRVIAWFGEDSDEPYPYIPASIRYVGRALDTPNGEV